MAKVKFEDPIAELHGKICSHSDTIYKEMYGTAFTSRICNPYTGEPSEAQVAQRNLFKQVRTAMAALTESDKTAYKTAFKNQRKYVSLNGYIFAQEYAKAKAAGEED